MIFICSHYNLIDNTAIEIPIISNQITQNNQYKNKNRIKNKIFNTVLNNNILHNNKNNINTIDNELAMYLSNLNDFYIKFNKLNIVENKQELCTLLLSESTKIRSTNTYAANNNFAYYRNNIIKYYSDLYGFIKYDKNDDFIMSYFKYCYNFLSNQISDIICRYPHYKTPNNLNLNLYNHIEIYNNNNEISNTSKIVQNLTRNSTRIEIFLEGSQNLYEKINKILDKFIKNQKCNFEIKPYMICNLKQALPGYYYKEDNHLQQYLNSIRKPKFYSLMNLDSKSNINKSNYIKTSTDICEYLKNINKRIDSIKNTTDDTKDIAGNIKKSIDKPKYVINLKNIPNMKIVILYYLFLTFIILINIIITIFYIFKNL